MKKPNAIKKSNTALTHDALASVSGGVGETVCGYVTTVCGDQWVCATSTEEESSGGLVNDVIIATSPSNTENVFTGSDAAAPRG